MSTGPAEPNGVLAGGGPAAKKRLSLWSGERNEMKRSGKLTITGKLLRDPDQDPTKKVRGEIGVKLWSVTGREGKMFGFHRQQLRSGQINTERL